MTELHATTRRIIQWAKRSLVATGRSEEGLAVRDLVCGLAALVDDEQVRAIVLEALGLDKEHATRLSFPASCLADLEKAASAAEVSAEFALQADLKEVVARAHGTSADLDPQALVRELLASDHPLVAELRALNGAPPASAAVGAPRMAPTPVLDAAGYDLTRAAREGKLQKVVGREELIGLVAETLCRRVKRNPLLIGPAGVGKTAVAEALAQRIAAGDVPPRLAGVRLVQIRPSVMIARATSLQSFLDGVESIVREASQPGIVLFIDEVHAMVGAGGPSGSTDMASLMKPALARGDIAVIAATTDYEYRRHLSIDPALDRRFVPLRVNELSADETLQVLDDLRPVIRSESGVEVPREVVLWVVDFAGRHMRNRFFPDKAIDLLDQCVAHVLMARGTAVAIEDAKTVARRMVGSTVDAAEAVARLRHELEGLGIVSEAAAEALSARLDVTLQSLDVRPERPNAVVLLADGAAAWSHALARTIARTVAGGEERVLSLDFAEYVHDADLTRLIGAPPGYVGYSDTLPIHQLLQMPAGVLSCENLHACHPRVREFLRGALASGVLRDGRGQSIYLSDTVVLITAQIDLARAAGPLGFHGSEPANHVDMPEPLVDQAVGLALGAPFVNEIDVVIHDGAGHGAGALPDARLGRWLAGLVERYRPLGVDVVWAPAMQEWLAERTRGLEARELERAIDTWISRPLALHLEQRRHGTAGEQRVIVLVAPGPGGVVIEEGPAASGDA